MLPLLRRSISAKALTTQPRAPPITLKAIKAFSTTSTRKNLTMASIEAGLDKQWKEEMEHGTAKYRHINAPGAPPVNPPYEHVTWENADFVGTTCLPNGDPIGFDTSAQGLTPEEAYWFGVQGWQDHEDQHLLHEQGWHVDQDGFLRGDERGPHLDFVNGGWYFDTKDGGKRYID